MADINDTNAAQSVKIIGANSSGVEQTPVGSNSQGELLISTQGEYRRIAGATTVTVKSGAGLLKRIIINRPTNGTATVYDNTTAAGTIIAIITYTNGTTPTYLEYGLNFTTGITIVTTGANTDLTIIYL